MTRHDDRADAQLDAALEALARPAPPAGHVEHVLARMDGPGRVGVGLTRGSVMRWALPVAAPLLVALAATWQVTRMPVVWPAIVDMDRATTRRPDRWGAADAIVRPVLPPEAYWAMDAFDEWRSLRPDDAGLVPGTGSLAPAVTPRSRTADDELAWTPVPSGLPEIELSSIVPAPLVVVPLDEPAPITLAQITLDPIELAPLDEQEKP